MAAPVISEVPRRKWLASLARLVSPSFPVEATEALIAYLPMLRGYPDSVFNDTSLEAAACCKRRQAVPALDELKAVLREFRPIVPALPAPVVQERQSPTAEVVSSIADKMRLFRDEVAERDAARPRERQARPVRRNRYDDAALLAQLERQAAPGYTGPGGGAVARQRLAALRERMGCPAPVPGQ